MGIIRDWAAATGGAQGTPVETTVALRRELGRKYQEALNHSGGNHEVAEQKLAQAIDLDRRYDSYLTDKLVDSFRSAYQNGSQLDFSDPVLKGGQPRPCQLRGAYNKGFR